MQSKKLDPVIRERIFGLYAGQKIMTSDSFLTEEGNYRMEKPVLQISGINGLFLRVKPLRTITEEHAIEVAKMAVPYTGRYELVDIKKTSFVFELPYVSSKFQCFPIKSVIVCLERNKEEIKEITPICNSIPIIDYLRGKGYALPAFGFRVQELYDLNVFWWPEDEDGPVGNKNENEKELAVSNTL